MDTEQSTVSARALQVEFCELPSSGKFSVAALARRFGVKNDQTFYRWLAYYKVPCYQIGRLTVVEMSEFWQQMPHGPYEQRKKADGGKKSKRRRVDLPGRQAVEGGRVPAPRSKRRTPAKDGDREEPG